MSSSSSSSKRRSKKGKKKAAAMSTGLGQSSTTSSLWAPPASSKAISHKPGTAEDLHQQLVMLQWRKAENDSRMKTVISATKVAQEEDLLVSMATNKAEEKAGWMQTIIRDELSRPLWFDADRMQYLEQDEQKEMARNQRSLMNQKKLLMQAKRSVKVREGRRKQPTGGGSGFQTQSQSQSQFQSQPMLPALTSPGTPATNGSSEFYTPIPSPADASGAAAAGAGRGGGAASPERDLLSTLNKTLKRNKKQLKKKKKVLTSVVVKERLKKRPPAPVRLAETLRS